MRSAAASRGAGRRPGRITEALLHDVVCSLTDRDRTILRLLRRHRVLTTSQIHRVFFTDRNTAQHRLTRLYQLRLVDRFRHHPRSGPRLGSRPGEGEYHYVLDRLGAVLLRWQHDPDVELARVRWRTDWARSIEFSQRLAHTVGVNDVFTRLLAPGRTAAGGGLVTWWGEAHCGQRFASVVRPDGVGVWQDESVRVVFCLEYDRGTETLTRLAGKTEQYARLEAAGWGPFWLLLAVPGPRREQRARAALSACGLAVATTTHAGAASPAGPVWAPLTANPDQKRVTLTALAGWPRPAASATRLAAAQAEFGALITPHRDGDGDALPPPPLVPLPSPADGASMDPPAERGA